jgi:hypothetical protein
VLDEAQDLLTNGNITFPRPEAELLLTIRQGGHTFAIVAQMIEEVVADRCAF